MSGQSLDAEASETVAGVVRLLRRAAELVWVAIDTDTAGFHRQLLALGIDLAADEARNLLPDAIPIDGPGPVGAEPASLLRSAEQLLRRIATARSGGRARCQEAHAINEIRSCNVSRTLIRVPSDHPRTKSSTKKTMPMILTATGRAVRRQHLLAHNPLPGDSRTWHTRLLRDRSRDGDFPSPPAEEPDQAGKEHDHGTAHGHRRRADRHAQGGPQRRVPADRSHAAGVDQDRPLAARITRLNPPRRSPECGGGRVDARTQPSGESATPGQAEETGDVLAALPVVDDCGRRRVSDVRPDRCQAASPDSRAPRDRAGTHLREAG